jgi:hypothetical protein
MKLYTVKYKKINSLFWKKLERVKGDGFVRDEIQTGPQEYRIVASHPARFFLLESEERIEIPIIGHLFKFGTDRFESIKERMDAEAGQNMPLDKR